MTDNERLARDISQHKGQWVLIKDGRVVAADASIKTAVRSLPLAERTKVTALFCPHKEFSGTIFSAL